jgi:hypothetical protein
MCQCCIDCQFWTPKNRYRLIHPILLPKYGNAPSQIDETHKLISSNDNGLRFDKICCIAVIVNPPAMEPCATL